MKRDQKQSDRLSHRTSEKTKHKRVILWWSNGHAISVVHQLLPVFIKWVRHLYASLSIFLVLKSLTRQLRPNMWCVHWCLVSFNENSRISRINSRTSHIKYKYTECLEVIMKHDKKQKTFGDCKKLTRRMSFNCTYEEGINACRQVLKDVLSKKRSKKCIESNR